MANTYYVANAGSDSNSGLSALLPFQTLTHAFTIASTNDTVLANGGDTFRETGTFSAATQTLGSYGTGNPILLGSDSANVSGDWTEEDVLPVPTFLQGNNAYNGSALTTMTVTLPSVSAGSLLVAHMEVNQTGLAVTCADNVNGAYTAVTPKDGTGFELVQFYFPNSAASASTVTVTFTFALTRSCRVGVAEYSNVATSSALRATSAGAGTGTALDSGTFTAVVGDLIVGTGFVGSPPVTVGSGFTARPTAYTADGNEFWEDTIAASTTGEASATQGSSAIWGLVGCSFKPSAGSTVLFYAASGSTVLQVMRDGTRMTKMASKAALVADGQWWWDSGNSRVYVYSVTNPVTAGHTFEFTTRDCVSVTSHQNITLQNLTLQNGFRGAQFVGNNSGFLVDTCLLTYCYTFGFVNQDSGSANSTSGTIQNCEISYCGGSGTHGATYAANWIIKNNLVHHCSLLSDTGVLDLQYTAGIRFYSPNGGGHTIQGNTVHDIGSVGVVGGCNAIHLDTVGTGCTVTNNVCYTTLNDGIYLECTSGVLVTFNVCYGHQANGFEINSRQVADGGAVANSNTLYNNVAYNNRDGFTLAGQGGTPDSGSLVNNVLKNNISFGNSRYALRVQDGGENDGTYGSGNVYTYNCFGAQATNFIQWGSSTYSTYALWNSASGAGAGITDHYVNADPQFTNAATGNFSLQATSPCIDAGVYIAGINNNFSGRAPDMGAFEFNQNSPNVMSPATNPNCVITPTGQNLFTAFLAV